MKEIAAFDEKTRDHMLSNQNEATVRVRDVSIAYTSRRSGRHVAISDVSFDVLEGELVCIVGPSGCGKTSLIKAVAGLRSIEHGEIDVRVRRGETPIGFVFQGSSLFPWRTVIANASYGAESAGMSRQVAYKQAREALQLVGLAGNEEKFPRQLSGGMQQRVNLARAIAANPAVLLLDEPFAALDAQLRERMQGELMRILETWNRSAVLVTHQVDEAVYLADRIVIMASSPGRIKEIVEVDLPKPRDLNCKRGARFLELCDYVWAQLGAENH